MLKYNILLVADVNFHDNVKDFTTYQRKLFDFLNNKVTGFELDIWSVKGKYCFDGALTLIEIDDKNKSSFTKSIGDYLSRIDEVILITNYVRDPYLENLRNHLNEENKPTTVFSYEIRDPHE